MDHALLFRFEPERAHALGLLAIQYASGLLQRGAPPLTPPWGPLRIAGLTFPHPVGLAAGFDKDAEVVAGLFRLGFGFVEVGTVTPRPQPGNPRPRLFRIPEAGALINRMGFNNAGTAAMVARLSRLGPLPGPVGVNIGKNKDTPLEEAPSDYAAAASAVAPHASYIAVNLSSPNTPGLRSLLEATALERILQATIAASQGRPIFLKVSPDLEPEAVDAVVDVALSLRIAGLGCTNTTVTRPGVSSAEAGGLSGKPLAPLALATLRRAAERARGRLALIGAGGISTGDDAWERLQAGACLVQLYTSFIYRGPHTARLVVSELERAWRRSGAPPLAGSATP